MQFHTLNTELSYVNMNSQNTNICMPSYSVQHVSKMKLYGEYRRHTFCLTIQTEYVHTERSKQY